MTSPVQKSYSILIVDDSEDDRFFLHRTISRFPRFKIAHECCDGQEAIAYLSGDAQYKNRQKYPLPDLLLLDLNMPRKTGFDVLDWLRTQCFPGLTVIVLSGSALAQDVGAALALGANGYWTKTSQENRQNKIAQEIEALLDKRRLPVGDPISN